jgi:hypothetical protein
MIAWFVSLPPTSQALVAGLFTWAVTASGAAAVFWTSQVHRKMLDAMLGFSDGVMLAASYWSLLALAIEISEHGPLARRGRWPRQQRDRGHDGPLAHAGLCQWRKGRRREAEAGCRLRRQKLQGVARWLRSDGPLHRQQRQIRSQVRLLLSPVENGGAFRGKMGALDLGGVKVRLRVVWDMDRLGAVRIVRDDVDPQSELRRIVAELCSTR